MCLGRNWALHILHVRAIFARRRYLEHMKRFRGGLVFKAHGRVHHSTRGWRVIKKKKTVPGAIQLPNRHHTTRWTTTLSSKVILHHAIDLWASYSLDGGTCSGSSRTPASARINRPSDRSARDTPLLSSLRADSNSSLAPPCRPLGFANRCTRDTYLLSGARVQGPMARIYSGINV